MAAYVLVVDDCRSNRLIEEDNLTSNGFKVATAKNGAEALTMLGIYNSEKTCDFDAVLLDVLMPEINGLDVLKAIRQKWNSTELPVIMATSQDQPDDVVAALRLGANDYVTKPTNKEILVARLQVHLAIKESREALKKAQNALVNAAKMESIGLLAAGTAHEVRNPLGQIQMAASGLTSLYPELSDKSKDVLKLISETIETAVDKADDIIRKLMRVTADQQLSMEKSDLNQEVEASIETLTPLIKAERITIQCIFAESLPPVLLSRSEFRQAFKAIAENAIQAMKLHSRTPGILTFRTEQTIMKGQIHFVGDRTGKRLRDGDKVVVLHIEDTGPGLDESIKDTVFDPFVTTKATGSGIGLGLTVTRKIIELHHGAIKLEPRDDVPTGLRVSIFLKAIQ